MYILIWISSYGPLFSYQEEQDAELRFRSETKTFTLFCSSSHAFLGPFYIQNYQKLHSTFVNESLEIVIVWSLSHV